MSTTIETLRKTLAAAPKIERDEITLDGLLGIVKTMQAAGTLNTDVRSIERDVIEAETSGDAEKIEAVKGRLAYLIRMGKTFAKFGTTAAEWRPLRGWNWNDTRGSYAVLGGISIPRAYTEITREKGYTLELGPEAEAKGASAYPDDTCSLCGHRPIVWSFPLVCDRLRIIVLSGSECVHMYVHAVIPSRDAAETEHKRAKSDFNREVAIKRANSKLDKLLAEPSGWGVTFGTLIEKGEPLAGLPVEKLDGARKSIEMTRAGRLYTETDRKVTERSVRECGFGATWIRVARKLAHEARIAPTAPAPTAPVPTAPETETLSERQIAIVGSVERFALLKAKGETDPKGLAGFWNHSFRAVREGWSLSPKWIAAIRKALDREMLKAVPAPAPVPAAKTVREGDVVMVEGEVIKVEHVGDDRSKYPHDKITVKNGSLVVIFKEYPSTKLSIGARVKVTGKAGWIMDRSASGSPLFVALNGRKTVSVL